MRIDEGKIKECIVLVVLVTLAIWVFIVVLMVVAVRLPVLNVVF